MLWTVAASRKAEKLLNFVFNVHVNLDVFRLLILLFVLQLCRQIHSQVWRCKGKLSIYYDQFLLPFSASVQCFCITHCHHVGFEAILLLAYVFNHVDPYYLK